MLKEVVDFSLMRSKFYPDMFRQMVATFRRSYVPYKLLKQCSVFGRIRIMIRPVWPAVVACIQVYTGGSVPAMTAAGTKPPLYTWIHSTTGHTGRIIIPIRPQYTHCSSIL
jgi:hypothetical protein